MVESKREKRIRFLLITFIVGIVMFALFFRNNQMEKNVTTDLVMAAVVQKAQRAEDNPTIVMYKFTDGKHILARYEIERENAYFFRTLEAVQFRSSLEEITNDLVDDGVWVKMSNKWYYFNDSLQEEKKSLDTKASSIKTIYTVSRARTENEIILSDNNKIRIGKDELVKEVHSLTTSGDLWLLITQSGVKISIIEKE